MSLKAFTSLNFCLLNNTNAKSLSPHHEFEGPGCLVVAGGLSVLATEFPGAQKVLNKGTDTLRKFGNGDSHEDELGLGFEIVEDPMAQTAQTAQTPLKSGVDSLRSVTREKIIPLIDRHFDASPNTSNSASTTPSTTVNENITSSTTADTFKTLYW